MDKNQLVEYLRHHANLPCIICRVLYNKECKHGDTSWMLYECFTFAFCFVVGFIIGILFKMYVDKENKKGETHDPKV